MYAYRRGGRRSLLAQPTIGSGDACEECAPDYDRQCAVLRFREVQFRAIPGNSIPLEWTCFADIPVVIILFSLRQSTRRKAVWGGRSPRARITAENLGLTIPPRHAYRICLSLIR
jgi:hypothetical protein